MRFQLGETIRILELTGRVVSRSSCVALIEFAQAGFLQVAYPVEGDHEAVITVSLPRSIVSPQSLPELRRQVCLTFDIHPGSRIAIKLCEPVRFGTAPNPSRQNVTPQAPLPDGSPVYPAELVTPHDVAGGSTEERYYERFGNSWEDPAPTYGQNRAQWERYQGYRVRVTSGSEKYAQYGTMFDDVVDRLNRHFETEPDELYSVPRRYDLASMFAISVAYALLFSIMRLLGCPPSLICLAGIFCAAVGAAQALMFGGKRPREASIIAGGVAGVICSIAFPVIQGWGVAEAVLAALCGVIWCPPVGYLAGATIGGIWLTADYLRKAAAKRLEKEQPEEHDTEDASVSEKHILDR